MFALTAHMLARFAYKITDGRFGRNDSFDEFVTDCKTASTNKIVEMPNPKEWTVSTPLYALGLGMLLVLLVMTTNWLTSKLATLYVYKLDTQDIPWWNIVAG